SGTNVPPRRLCLRRERLIPDTRSSLRWPPHQHDDYSAAQSRWLACRGEGTDRRQTDRDPAVTAEGESGPCPSAPLQDREILHTEPAAAGARDEGCLSWC